MKQKFQVTVTPAYFVHACSARLEQESRGSYGFHDSHRCSDCAIEFDGFELWGENGHKQGSCRTLDHVAHAIKVSNFRSKAGGNSFYVGRNASAYQGRRESAADISARMQETRERFS